MMKYLGLIAGWFLVAAAMLVLLVIVAFAPFAGLTAAGVGKVFGLWILIGLLGAVLGGVVAYFKVKGFVNDIKEMVDDLKTEDPGNKAYVVEVKPLEGEGLIQEDQGAQAMKKDLLDAGFVHEGEFVLDQAAGIEMSAFLNTLRKVRAVVYCQAGEGPWMDIVSDLPNGGSVYVSNIQTPMVTDTRPTVIRVVQPGAGVQELLQIFEKNKPAGGLATPAPTFAESLEKSWWTDQSWRRLRGGTTMGEVNRMRNAGSVGDESTTNEDLKSALDQENEQWDNAWSSVPGQLIDRHLKGAGLDDNDDAWSDRHSRLVAAFEGQSLDEFTEYLAERLNNLHETVLQEHGHDDPDQTQTFKPTGFRPGADGYKLQAAAEGQDDGLSGAKAIFAKYPEWFKEVFVGSHPMRHAVYEVAVK